nr:hypothetical protein [Tanacetum cinerariifolium]
MGLKENDTWDRRQGNMGCWGECIGTVPVRVSVQERLVWGVVVAQNNVHEEVVEEVIEMANDQAEALSSDKEVTDECLDDKHVKERRPSKRIRVT